MHDDFDEDFESGEYNEYAGPGGGALRKFAQVQAAHRRRGAAAPAGENNNPAGPLPAAEPAPTPEATPEAVETPAKVALTPIHAPAYYVMPNDLARCSLFRVADPTKPRATLKNVQLSVYASQGGCIAYSGPELRQDDKRVFMHALELEATGEHDPTDPNPHAMIRLYPFLPAIGWSDSKTNRQKLLDCLSRLHDGGLVVNTPRFKSPFAVKLVRRIDWPEGWDGPVVKLTFEPEVRELFGANHYARVLRQFVLKLGKRCYLADWLLSFYSTHKAAIPLAIDLLKELSGDTTEKKHFRPKLEAALDHLKHIGFLERWSYEFGSLAKDRKKVCVVRT